MTDTETSQESFGKSPDSILQSNFEEPGEGKYVSHEEIKLLSDEIKKTKDDAKETKENIKQATTFTMWVAGAIVVAFFLAGMPIFLDYCKNNEERYEKFIDKTEEIKNNFYAKEDLKILIEESNKNKQILDCLKIKGYFTIQCFNQ